MRAGGASRVRCRERRPVAGGALGAVWAPLTQRSASCRQQERPDVGFGKLFGEISAPAALADLLPIVRSWRPELVVNDAAEFAAPIAAAAIGVPHVTHAFGALLPEARVRRADEEVAPLWRAEGLEPRPYGGLYDHLYLDIYPPSLQAPGGDHLGARQLLRPVAFAGATEEGFAPTSPIEPEGRSYT